MRTFDVGWMGAAACAAPAQRRLPWQGDTDTLPVVLVEVMRRVCASCPVAVDCGGYVDHAGITGGFWAGAYRDPAAVVMQLDLLERDVLAPDVLDGAA